MKRVVQGLAGLVFGLGLVEVAFTVRDNGAFPHVNFYLPDAELGLVLEPGATERISFSGNPVTSVRINQAGFRGEDWPAPSARELVVVGDSQVFGLGVEEDETFSARLAEAWDGTVINAGVPTYGPLEYSAVARRLVAERKPRMVIYTVNMVNDLFEWDAPNTDRHAEWDGWAVRSETAPGGLLPLPGRRFVSRHSHALFAWRSLSAQAATGARAGLPSEGTWTDLVDHGRLARESAEARHADVDERRKQVAQVQQELDEVQATLGRQVAETMDALTGTVEDRKILMQALQGHPGDIVGVDYGEEAREVAVTAELMRQGARYREKVIARLKQRRDLDIAAIDANLGKREELEAARQAAVSAALAEDGLRLSVLAPELEALRDFCADHGTELVVLVLPVDVQVAVEEWFKYDVDEPVDMEPSLVLLDDLHADAAALGLRTVDPLRKLRQAEPGAFLHGDIHLTPKGHAAVAEAVFEVLGQPAPVARPVPGLPEGRTWMPRQEDWLRTPENLVRGSSAAHCETVRIDEWLRLTCKAAPGRKPVGATVVRGDHGEAWVTATRDAINLVVPLFPGEELEAVLYWAGFGQTLTVSWEGEEARMALGPVDRSVSLERTVAERALDAKLCGCYGEVRGEKVCETHGPAELEPDRLDHYPLSWVRACESTCTHMFGGNLAECADTYGDDCPGFVACAEGRLTALPECNDGEVRVGGSGTCLPLCDEDTPCADGDSCHPYQGTGVCW